MTNERTIGRGKGLVEKYLGEANVKADHSIQIGNCGHMIADLVAQANPELELKVEEVGFLAYVHDIGQSITPAKHELLTVELLVKEGYPLDFAIQSMHGQLIEQFSQDEASHLYVPVGYAGKIITLADMTMDSKDNVIAVEERAERIKVAVGKIPDKFVSQELKKDICDGMNAALPRFKEYRDELFDLMGVDLAGLSAEYESRYCSE